MILSAQTIKRLGLVDPCLDRGVYNGASFGLGPASYDVTLGQELIIPPGGFVLGSINEYINLPAHISAQVADKSSWARQGISLFNTFVDPGFKGYLTVEIANHSQWGVCIPKYSPIAQLIFNTLDEATDRPYRGKYQDQPAKPIHAKYEGK